MPRKLLCVMMIAVLPVSLLAADSAGAMLYAKGTAWLNGSTVPRSSAVFPGDLIQTKVNSVANINAAGSNVLIAADSLVKFEEGALDVEHGSLHVATSKKMSARAGEVKVEPASDSWTQYDVSEKDGTVQIIAQKGDVSVTDETGTSTLSQGQQTTRDESQQKAQKKRKGGALPAAGGSILDSKAALYGGIGVAGALTGFVLSQGDEPVSPAKP
jgi:hypothetical protein